MSDLIKDTLLVKSFPAFQMFLTNYFEFTNPTQAQRKEIEANLVTSIIIHITHDVEQTNADKSAVSVIAKNIDTSKGMAELFVYLQKVFKGDGKSLIDIFQKNMISTCTFLLTETSTLTTEQKEALEENMASIL